MLLVLARYGEVFDCRTDCDEDPFELPDSCVKQINSLKFLKESVA
jgi:hypothetical protein